MPSDPLDSISTEFLARALRLGTAILFTGAGFSSAARNRAGEPIPLGSELKGRLWSLAFPSEPFDPASSLGEVFDIASHLQRRATGELLHELLTVDSGTLPTWYESYFQVPWYRFYTLNLDTLPQAADSAFHLSDELRISSALTEPLPAPDQLAVVHLNGTLRNYPGVTFSPPQYGARASRSDTAYASLARDLLSHPVVFIGTQLDEPPLWQYIGLRGEPPSGRELRPKSFLVVPSLPRARAAMLERFNVRHVPLDAEQFAERFLKPAVSAGVVRPSYSTTTGNPYEGLDVALGEPPNAPADFLLGREPTWSDITAGFAIERSFESTLHDAATDEHNRVILITGTAGAGKSTTLRRVALTLQSEGKNVKWLRPESAESVAQLRAAGLASDADAIAIDQTERFRGRGVDLIRGLAEPEDGPQVIAAYSGGPFDELQIEQVLSDLSPLTAEVPLLDDDDIRGLVDALTRANRLGRLAGLAPDQQFDAIKQRSDRQLLVAMLEATSGERFEVKIVKECEALAPDLTTTYAVVSLATSHRYALGVDDLLSSLSDVSSAGLELVDRLVRQHLILRLRNGTLVARHPVIAREVVTHFRKTGQLAEAISRLAFVMASKFYVGMPRSTRERRLLETLIRHEYVGFVIDSVVQAREMYAELEGLLREESHYWLQRGSYELERGDMTEAENFLAQARAHSDGDFMVETEWAYLMMKRACLDPRNALAAEWFSEGAAILYDTIDKVGARSPNTFVILADKSVDWITVAPLSLDEKKRILEPVRLVLKEGNRHHGANRQFEACQKRLEDAYLALAL
jgi:hypothetical protein